MGKGYYHQIIKILKKELGAYYVRNGKGSHEIWKTRDGLPVTVPRNCYVRTTANEVLKQAGLNKRF